MKLKKRTVMLLSFTVGTLMFATTALAEVNSKSGYDQIKDAFKYTAESCSSKLQNYTIDTSYVVKDNDKIIFSENRVSKYDAAKYAHEDRAVSVNFNNDKAESYSYTDKNCTVNYDSTQDTYYVTKYDRPDNQPLFSNPFKESMAGDMEKIADALVGNLKDYVVVNVKPDGSRELSGSISESQIPALINALASFGFKSTFSGGYYAARSGLGTANGNAPIVVKDAYVKNAKGNMVVNKDGLVESILGTGTLSGKDDKGTEHTISFELLGKLHDINSTVVNKPDLTGKNVQEESKEEGTKPSPKKYTGQYTGDIVIEKDGKLEKIGEKILDIERSDDKVIAGRYHEEYKKGYEKYAADKNDFKFEASFNKDPYNTSFTYTDSSGKSKEGSISLLPYGLKLYFYMSNPIKTQVINDGELTKVFD